MLLRELKSIEKTGSGYVLHGDAADVLLIFMTDDVIRVRVSFRRDFKEESAGDYRLGGSDGRTFKGRAHTHQVPGYSL